MTDLQNPGYALTGMPSAVPQTKAGQLIALLPQIESWFLSGYKTSEVMHRLAEREGIRVSRQYLCRLLSQYGMAESMIRRGIRNGDKRTPVRSPADALADLRQKESSRVQFRLDPNPKKEDLI